MYTHIPEARKLDILRKIQQKEHPHTENNSKTVRKIYK
jgi:hypothetical protein